MTPCTNTTGCKIYQEGSVDREYILSFVVACIVKVIVSNMKVLKFPSFHLSLIIDLLNRKRRLRVFCKF